MSGCQYCSPGMKHPAAISLYGCTASGHSGRANGACTSTSKGASIDAITWASDLSLFICEVKALLSLAPSFSFGHRNMPVSLTQNTCFLERFSMSHFSLTTGNSRNLRSGFDDVQIE